MINSTTTTPATTTYKIEYAVPCYYEIEVERPVGITQDELLQSITREVFDNTDGELRDWYGALKDAWRTDDVSCIEMTDEDGEFQQAF